MEEFSIELGAKLKLNNLQEQINKASSNLKPLEITINTEKSEKKITALTEQISKLNNEFKIMENIGSLSSNLDVINKSLKSIATVIDKINKADGFNNLGKGLSSFAPVAEMIKNELSSIKTTMESFKGFNLNFDIKPTISKDALSVAKENALFELRQQLNAIESVYMQYTKAENVIDAAVKAFRGTEFGTKNNVLKSGLIAHDESLTINQQISAVQNYINMLQQGAKTIEGINLTSVTSAFTKTADEIVASSSKISSGEQMLSDETNQLKKIFGSGIDAEKLTTQLDTIKVSIDNVSTAISGIKFDDSTLQAFRETIGSLNTTIQQLSKSITELDGKSIISKTATTGIAQTTQEIQKAEAETQKLKQTTEQIKPIGNVLVNPDVIKSFEDKVQQVIYSEKELEKITRETFGQFGDVTTNTTKTVSHEIDTFAVKIKNLKTNITETLRFRLNPDSGYYKYQGSSGSDNYARQQEVINKQIEKNNAAVTNYTATLNKLEKEYQDVNATKPIQDTNHLETLKNLLDIAREKVDALKTATKEHYATTEASAKSAITAFETQIRLFRQEEYAANQLRAKPIETIKAEQVELLRKFRAEIEASGIAFNKFKTFNISQLSGKVNGITDKQSLMDYLNSLSVAQAEFKALQAEQKNYSQMQKASADKEKAVLKEVENEYQNLISLVGQIGKKRISLFGLDSESEKDIPKITRIKEELRDLYTQYAKAKMTFTTNFPTYNLDELKVKWQGILRSIELVKNETIGNIAYKSSQEEINKEATAYKELLSSFDKYKAERIALSKISKDSPEYSVVSQQVNKLLSEYQKLRTEFTANYPTHNLDELNNKLQELDYNLNRVQSKKTHKLNEKELAQLDATEVEKYNQALKQMADEQNSRIIQEKNQYKELISLVNQLGTAQKELSRTKIDNPEYGTVLQRVQQLSSAYQKAKMEFISAYPTHPLDELKAKLEEIGYVVQKNNDKQLGKQQTVLFNELNRVGKEMDFIQVKLQTLKSSSGINEHTEQIKELERQLVTLETIYQEVMTQINNNGGLTDNQYAKIYTDIEMLDAKLKEISASAIDAQTKLSNSIKGDISNGTLNNQIQTIENDYRRLGLTEEQIAQKTQTLKSLLKTMGASDDIESVTRDYTAFGQELVKVQNDVKALRREQQKAIDEANLANNRQTLNSQIDVWLKKNSAAASQFGVRLREIQQELLTADGTKLTALKREFQEIKRQAELAGKATMTLGDRLKSKLGSLATYFSATMMISYAIQGVRAMYQNVLDVDTAMTELYRVTDLTGQQYSQLYDNMVAGAKKYGVALNDIIESTASWVRLGFEANTASQLAEITAMYQHVTDLDNDTAVKNLVTAYKGYQEELLQVSDGDSAKAVTRVADVYDKLGNEFAVTAADVGEGLRRSASSLEMAGNSFEEAAGMSTGITEVTQNAEQAGTSLNVVSLRLRGMKGQLEEIGEEVDENVESISKMQTHILNLTHGKVNIFKDNGEFKSTYQIFKEISQIWNDLTDTSRADLLETIAGKQRSNSIAALVNNWSNVEKAVEAASNAEGTAAAENEKYMQSMQGKLDAFNASWQALSNTFLSSDLLKVLIDMLTGVVNNIDGITDSIGVLGTALTAVGITAFIKNLD